MKRIRLTFAIVMILMSLPFLLPVMTSLEPVTERLTGETEIPFELDRSTTPVGSGRSDDRIGTSAFDPFKVGTALDGSNEEWASDIYVDSGGFVYVTGYTKSGDFPTTVASYQQTHRGTSFYDAFVVKYFPNGSVYYSTFLGGEFTDIAWGVRARDGYCYVVGYTENATSPFPTTSGALNQSHNGNYDIFLSVLSPNGSVLSYSTFLGGFGDDFGYQLELSGDVVYISGSTESSATWPATLGAWDDTMGGTRDAFLMAVDLADFSASTLNYSTLIGGSDWDESRDLAIVADTDTEKIIGISGLTDSSDFPTTSGAYDSLIGPGRSVFLFELNITDWTTSVHNYGTFLGGSQGGAEYDFPALDFAGDDYAIALSTPASDFPISANPFQSSPVGGSYSGYVCSFRTIPGGDALRMGTYLSGKSTDHIIDVTADDSRGGVHMMVTGSTASDDFPAVGLRSNSLTGTRDSFLAIFGPVENWGARLNFSSTHHQDSSEMVAVCAKSNGDAVTFGHSTLGPLISQDCLSVDWTVPDTPRIRLVSFRNVTEVNSTFEVRVQAEGRNDLSGSEIEKVTLEVYPEGNADIRITGNATSPVSGTDNVYSCSVEIPARWEGLRLEWYCHAYSADYGRATVSEDLEIEGVPWKGRPSAPWVPPLFSIYSSYAIAVLFILGTLFSTVVTGVLAPKAKIPRGEIGVPGYVLTALAVGLGGFLTFGIATTLFPLLNVIGTVTFTIAWSIQATRYAIDPKHRKNRWRWLFWGGAIGLGTLASYLAYQITTGVITNVWFWTFTVGAAAMTLAGFGRKRLSKVKFRGFTLEYIMWIASIAVSVLTALSLLGFLPI